MTSTGYSKAFAGLPTNGLITAFGNLTGVLSQPGAANLNSRSDNSIESYRAGKL